MEVNFCITKFQMLSLLQQEKKVVGAFANFWFFLLTGGRQRDDSD